MTIIHFYLFLKPFNNAVQTMITAPFRLKGFFSLYESMKLYDIIGLMTYPKVDQLIFI